MIKARAVVLMIFFASAVVDSVAAVTQSEIAYKGDERFYPYVTLVEGLEITEVLHDVHGDPWRVLKSPLQAHVEIFRKGRNDYYVIVEVKNPLDRPWFHPSFDAEVLNSGFLHFNTAENTNVYDWPPQYDETGRGRPVMGDFMFIEIPAKGSMRYKHKIDLDELLRSGADDFVVLYASNQMPEALGEYFLNNNQRIDVSIRSNSVCFNVRGSNEDRQIVEHPCVGEESLP